MTVRDLDAFAAALGLPEPDDDADAMLDAIEDGHGAAAVDRVLVAFGARSDRERYRVLFADPALALEVTWRYAGAATRALLVVAVTRLAHAPTPPPPSARLPPVPLETAPRISDLISPIASLEPSAPVPPVISDGFPARAGLTARVAEAGVPIWKKSPVG